MSGKLKIIKNIFINPTSVLAEGRELYKTSEKTGFDELSKHLYGSLNCQYPKFHKMDRLCKLAFLATEILSADGILNGTDPERVALFFENRSSTVDTDKKFLDSMNSIPSPALFVYTLPNILMGELSIRHGWKGENLFLVQDEFNAPEFYEQIEMLFTYSSTENCIAGWVEYEDNLNFTACLWLISKPAEKHYRRLTPNELTSDFSIFNL